LTAPKPTAVLLDELVYTFEQTLTRFGSEMDLELPAAGAAGRADNFLKPIDEHGLPAGGVGSLTLPRKH
jgi:hypothetical protein